MNGTPLKVIDKWIIGESWISSKVENLLEKLCIEIGSRWASSKNERKAANAIFSFWEDNGLSVSHENFVIDSWEFEESQLNLDGRSLDIKPYHRCPSVDLKAKLIDIGHGTKREVNENLDQIKGKIVLMFRKHEPFTQNEPLSEKINNIAKAGAVVTIIGEPKQGRRMEYSSVWDTRNPKSISPPLPVVNTSYEHLLLLKKISSKNIEAHVKVKTRFFKGKTSNVIAEIPGEYKGEQIIMCGHHDTVFDTPGGNDNTSGAIGVIETARLVNNIFKEFNITPKIGLKFITLTAEEQRLQGSFFHVKNNFSNSEIKPRLVINCDELSTGSMKGIVLGFPHLRNFMQYILNDLNEDFKVHVMSQLDGNSDHFPFLEAGIDACHPWRWRFHGRYDSCEYHHETPDTFDKLNIKDLKYYVSSFARILFRLSMTNPDDWPNNKLTRKDLRERLDAEKKHEIRTS